MTTPRPFHVAIPDSDVEKIMSRLHAATWPDMPDAVIANDWSHGANFNFMRDLVTYWLDTYDWRKAEAGLNRFPQFIARMADCDIHYVFEKGSNTRPRPLLLIHGWPGSHFEFLHIVEKLAHPERFGGRAEEGFDVVVPSLPGFGFSSKVHKPSRPRHIARLLDRLMHEVLGFSAYVAHGGDWGSLISGWLAYEGKACVGAHLNFFFWRASGVVSQTPEEHAFDAAFMATFEASNAYFKVQVATPMTLSFAMEDSPLGAAAWIIDKFNAWSDIGAGGIAATYTKDQLITNVMIYLVNRAFTSATWIYRGYFEDFAVDPLPLNSRIERPIGVANFPKDFLPWPPRALAERHMNVARWTDMPSGGHFAALERPELLVADISGFARDIGF